MTMNAIYKRSWFDTSEDKLMDEESDAALLAIEKNIRTIAGAKNSIFFVEL